MPKGVYVKTEQHRQNLIKAYANPELRRLKSEAQSKVMADPLRRQRTSEAVKKTKGTVENRQHVSEVMKKIRSTPEARKRQSEINVKRMAEGRVGRTKNQNTQPELQMRQILIDLQYSFVPQFEIYGVVGNYTTDFYLPELNLIIETYGTYHHMDPRKYKSTDYNKMLKKTAQQIWDYDANRQQEILSKGYKFLVFWYKEFNKELVEERINETIS